MERLLEDCVTAFARFPGIGKKTALRLTLHLIKQENKEVEEFSAALLRLKSGIQHCQICHNLTDQNICSVCENPARDKKTVCVVSDVRDLLALEAAGVYKGLYHVLGGLIAPIEGIGPEKLSIDLLFTRLQNGETQEVILALPATLEGETTSFYLNRKIQPLGIPVSVIARGISIGSELEYADELTLARSLSHRTPFSQRA